MYKTSFKLHGDLWNVKMNRITTGYKLIPILAQLKDFVCEDFKEKLKYFTKQMLSFSLLTVLRNTVDEPVH